MSPGAQGQLATSITQERGQAPALDSPGLLQDGQAVLRAGEQGQYPLPAGKNGRLET
jgi:hypothetical protein